MDGRSQVVACCLLGEKGFVLSVVVWFIKSGETGGSLAGYSHHTKGGQEGQWGLASLAVLILGKGTWYLAGTCRSKPRRNTLGIAGDRAAPGDTEVGGRMSLGARGTWCRGWADFRE
ncbi:hypothetical protein QBC39DRAFT_337740 [Podospora conica]|nr:hypothetical protein QBC39DRAFT_337740 [Schizothecium conicum]